MATTVTLNTNRLTIAQAGVPKASTTYINISRMQILIKEDTRITGTLQWQMLTPTYGKTYQYIVELHTKDGNTPEQILLGQVSNQAGWTNDAAGYINAETDIYAAFP